MDELRFAWDPRKAIANRHKHGISFEEAATVFSDDNALLVSDPAHSGDEDRFALLGLSDRLRILVVIHTLRDHGDTIRVVFRPQSDET